ncbi:MAG: PKD domain-containing protein, partial [Patescibacteria group bacterium]
MKKLTTILVIVLVILGVAVLYNSSSAVLPDGLFGAPRPIGDSGIHMPEDSTIFQEVNLAPAPSPANHAPTLSSINANDSVLTLPNHTVELGATVRDDLLPSPHSVRATWSQLNGSGIVFSPSFNQNSAGEFSANTTATLPAVPGTYTIKLTASDGVLISQTRTINITLNEPAPNSAPTANIVQENFVVIDNNDDGSELVTVSGSCDDVNNNLASCKWYDGATFLANDVAGNNIFNLSINTHPLILKATDVLGLTGEDSVIVTVEPPPDNPCDENQPPVANAGPDQLGNVGTNFVFNASDSTDLNGNNTITSYWWNFGDGQA